MNKPEDIVCGCAGLQERNKPLFYLANLVAELERQAEAKKAKESANGAVDRGRDRPAVTD